MKTQYILIDFENTQPKDFSKLQEHDFKVLVFVGASQTKIPFDLAESMQAMGAKAEYIKISGNGSNALDFHIAYYIGQLAEKDPDAFFHIISKDTGFDPLVKHLKGNKIKILREKRLSEIPVLKISHAKTNKDKVSAIVDYLISRGQHRPRKVKTLSNTINSIFRHALDEQEVAALVAQLAIKQLISIENEKITYALPDKQA